MNNFPSYARNTKHETQCFITFQTPRIELKFLNLLKHLAEYFR